MIRSLLLLLVLATPHDSNALPVVTREQEKITRVQAVAADAVANKANSTTARTQATSTAAATNKSNSAITPCESGACGKIIATDVVTKVNSILTTFNTFWSENPIDTAPSGEAELGNTWCPSKNKLLKQLQAAAETSNVANWYEPLEQARKDSTEELLTAIAKYERDGIASGATGAVGGATAVSAILLGPIALAISAGVSVSSMVLKGVANHEHQDIIDELQRLGDGDWLDSPYGHEERLDALLELQRCQAYWATADKVLADRRNTSNVIFQNSSCVNAHCPRTSEGFSNLNMTDVAGVLQAFIGGGVLEGGGLGSADRIKQRFDHGLPLLTSTDHVAIADLVNTLVGDAESLEITGAMIGDVINSVMLMYFARFCAVAVPLTGESLNTIDMDIWGWSRSADFGHQVDLYTAANEDQVVATSLVASRLSALKWAFAGERVTLRFSFGSVNMDQLPKVLELTDTVQFEHLAAGLLDDFERQEVALGNLPPLGAVEHARANKARRLPGGPVGMEEARRLMVYEHMLEAGMVEEVPGMELTYGLLDHAMQSPAELQAAANVGEMAEEEAGVVFDALAAGSAALKAFEGILGSIQITLGVLQIISTSDEAGDLRDYTHKLDDARKGYNNMLKTLFTGQGL